jgi:small subunit ribosomal protein S13
MKLPDTEKPDEETKVKSNEKSDKTTDAIAEESKKQQTDESKTVETEPKTVQQDKKLELESKKQKGEKPKKEAKKKEAKDDFKYIVRIANTDIDGEKNLFHGLTSIKGIGLHMSTLIIEKTGLDGNKKVGNLTDNEIELIASTLTDIANIAPDWMLNHRKDYDTGNDIHLIGPEIDMRLRDEINIMKKIRSYRGIRHERGLPVRGQRTRANSRKGLTLGVSKKREQK